LPVFTSTIEKNKIIAAFWNPLYNWVWRLCNWILDYRILDYSTIGWWKHGTFLWFQTTQF
jgi:hypothetical protein